MLAEKDAETDDENSAKYQNFILTSGKKKCMIIGGYCSAEAHCIAVCNATLNTTIN
jgi:hypothetical protein